MATVFIPAHRPAAETVARRNDATVAYDGRWVGMRTTSIIGCAVLLLSSACSGGDPTPPSNNDHPIPPPAHDDAGAVGDAKAPDANKDADAAPTCDLPGTGTPTKLYSAMFQDMPSNLQAYNGILYWASTDENDNSGAVNAYVLSQNRYFSMYSAMSLRSLNVDAYGVYFTDFAAITMNHYDLNGGNFTALSTVSGNYPLLRTDGGYEFFAGTAADHSDNELYLTDSSGQWDLNHGLKGPFTEFVAADDSNAYFLTFAEPTNASKEIDLYRADRKLDLTSEVGIVGFQDVEPTGFAIDSTTVYVAAKGTDASLGKIPKTGSWTDWTDLVVEGGLENLAVGTTYVYFTDAGGRLRRVAKDGSKPAEVVFTPCGRVETVTTVGDTAYFIQSLEDSKNDIVVWSVK